MAVDVVSQFDRSLARGRSAVCAMFFANGFVIGHWAPKIPVMVDRLGITEATLGQMIILFGLGAVISLIVGAGMVLRFGSMPVVRWTSLLLTPSLVLLTITPTVITTAIAMLWLGMFLGAMDNAMNANGVEVEIGLKKPVMSSYHGFWSLGGVAGGLTGGGLLAYYGEMGHAIIVSAMTLAIVLYAWPRVYSSTASPVGSNEDSQAFKKFQLPRAVGIYMLGIATMLLFAPEGTAIDWSALYLRDELNAPTLITGYAVAAFSLAMAIMRFLGDRIRSRFGDVLVFFASVFFGAVGFAVAGTAKGVVSACLGFLIAGFGLANAVPIVFSAAGKFPAVSPSVGIAIITVFGYGGLLFIPALVGFVAETFSLGFVFAAWGVVLLAIALMTPVIRQYISTSKT
ncbi:MAG: MFS transporter [Pseudomonadota bacterium]